MELLQVNNKEPMQVSSLIPMVIDKVQVLSSAKPFIEANTIASSLEDIKQGHIIPVFIKDNEPVISHYEFIESTLEMVADIFHGEHILRPNIRLSHPIKGRVPEARNKPAMELLEGEKTIYYERMAFVVEIPSIHTDIGGNRLNLTIGGVKSYNLDNLYNKSGADQHFKVFAGFQNTVCTNLCISTDGFLENMRVKDLGQLQAEIHEFLRDYNVVNYGQELKALEDYSLSEQQFANLIGRCRMYKFLPEGANIAPLLFGDGQINTVCKDYYDDRTFSRSKDGSINLWSLYNLFTGANKSTYIDNFLDRSVNAFQLAQELKGALMNKSECWYLN